MHGEKQESKNASCQAEKLGLERAGAARTGVGVVSAERMPVLV